MTSEELDRGDHGTATLSLSNLRASLLKMPASYEINNELEMVHEKLSLMLNDPKLSRKRLSRESLCSRTNLDEGDDDQS
ncbi:hypothetical protein KBY86_03480 [Synechococcus sp. Lug-A]|uniref:hypothetical protein n=1 Tax=Synechococcus sp. Lug-A TaxID=2823740 RepID=UPI0020CEF8C4|nr:hypothetical protein [Synechococcus sp. Lug-A]MCP9845957.1 hypothetical protein [Synechococcus sp. Lug-A]